MDARKVETDQVADVTGREIVTTRIIDAPRERVWRAFADPKALVQWWGPNGFTLTTEIFEFEEGGDWIFVMHGPDGRDYPGQVHFQEILEPIRMVHNHGGDEGKVNFHAEITLDAIGDSTRVTFRSAFNSKEERDFVAKEYDAVEGGKQNLARLDNYLKGKRTIE